MNIVWGKVPAESEAGASMVEYALLIVLIALIALVAVSIVGEEISTTFRSVARTLSSN